ncbi:hypothetical protein QJS66_14955 [Kocuria rhizophila]|nr:hypothetical protein QJS66_14955 [Kocuria rhizophila]
MLTRSESYREPPAPAHPERAQRATHTFWTDWASAVDCDGDTTRSIKRSPPALRALTHSRLGIVAAPTAGLPEDFGRAQLGLPLHVAADAALTIGALVKARPRVRRTAGGGTWPPRVVAGNLDQLKSSTAWTGAATSHPVPAWSTSAATRARVRARISATAARRTSTRRTWPVRS